MTVLTDHSAVKSVLETSTPSGKHTWWWTRAYNAGVRSVKIVYRAGRENASADTLSISPSTSPPSQGIAEGEVQVAAISTSEDFTWLLQAGPVSSIQNQTDYYVEQLKDPSPEGGDEASRERQVDSFLSWTESSTTSIRDTTITRES